MTATDELSRMLDERGVEYKDRDMYGKHVFHWGEPLHGAMFTDGGEWTELVIENASPDQAIAATLGDADATRERHGVGTCHDKCSRFNAWVCSECDATVLLMFDDYGEPSYSVDGVADVPHFCPNCGKRVEVSDG